MERQSALDGRRASMYDPARDVYTVTEEPHDAAKLETSSRPTEQPREKSERDDISATTGTTTDAPQSTHGASPLPPSVAAATAKANIPPNPSQASPLNKPVSSTAAFKLSQAYQGSQGKAMAQTSDSPQSGEVRRDEQHVVKEDSEPSKRAGNEIVKEAAATEEGARDDKEKSTLEQPSGQSAPTPAPRQAPRRKRQEERTLKNRNRAKETHSAYARRDLSPDTRHRRSPSTSPRRRSRSPDGSRRDSPPQRRSPSPAPREKSPAPEAPTRQRKRPGSGALLGQAEKERLRRRQEERERREREDLEQELRHRGVFDVVRQHYNSIPERGREWRRTDSKIKGLRCFNNWVKSALIHKFSPNESGEKDWAADALPPQDDREPLLVVDFGCGKGGDLGKWHQAPQPVRLYVGLDPAEISIQQARERYLGMRRGRQRGRRLFDAEFYIKDCFGEWLGDVPAIKRVGIDPHVGPGGNPMAARWGGGGFDVVASMFTMHYAFESEEKARQMLHNVAGLLKKGGRFIGVGPNSDVISSKVVEWHAKRRARQENQASKQSDEEQESKQGDANGREDGEVEDDETPQWGNSIYRVRFPGPTPEDGVFRPPFGWKYSYYMEEAVEGVPEYVVPWEAFRALAQDYNLEMQYRKPFLDMWKEEKDGPDLGPLSERMGVRERGGGPMLVSDEELEAASFYHAFCFYKT